jgi:SAM-dependent methyltransferase
LQFQEHPRTNVDVIDYNRQAWDGLVRRGDEWTLPVSRETIEAARRGNWQILLTSRRPVPGEWFPPLNGTRTLCLAGSGGQQAPILAAAGAVVTVFDNSPAQLGQDRLVADRDNLAIETVQGDMRDLSAFADGRFDLIVHPCSNCFVPDVRPVWREAFRVLRPGGVLLSGFINPVAFIFDEEASDRGELRARHRLPYADETHLTDEERQQLIHRGEPFVFSHSLEDQIGGQIEAGFTIAALFEDEWPGKPLSMFAPSFIATRSLKPGISAAGQ